MKIDLICFKNEHTTDIKERTALEARCEEKEGRLRETRRRAVVSGINKADLERRRTQTCTRVAGFVMQQGDTKETIVVSMQLLIKQN